MRKLKLTLAGLLLGAASILAWPDGRTALHAVVLRQELRLSEPRDRARTREQLLLLGRPSIEPVLPELVADEVEARLGKDSAVAIGHWYQVVSTAMWKQEDAREDLEKHHAHDREFHYELEEVLRDQPELALAKRRVVLLTGFPDSTAGKAFWKRDSRRELLLLERTGDFSPDARVVLVVPVDDEHGPAVIAAVRSRLGSR